MLLIKNVLYAIGLALSVIAAIVILLEAVEGREGYHLFDNILYIAVLLGFCVTAFLRNARRSLAVISFSSSISTLIIVGILDKIVALTAFHRLSPAIVLFDRTIFFDLFYLFIFVTLVLLESMAVKVAYDSTPSPAPPL